MSWKISLEEQLENLHGETVEFWLRDDDAVTDGPKLQRLFDFAKNIPLNVAVIPKHAERIDLPENVFVQQHGYDHENYAQEGEKNSEFPACRESARDELQLGLNRLEALYGDRFRRVFAPPWNRIDRIHLVTLKEIGFTHLSSHCRHPPSELIDIPVHVNINRWNRPNFLDHLSEQIDKGERLIGILTHHTMHDEDCWCALEQFISTIEKSPHAKWVDPV